MLKRETFAIADINVPIKRRATLEQKRVDEIAASMLDEGQKTPIMVRSDVARFVLVEGLHRLEAPRRLARKPLLDSASRRESIELLRVLTVCCRYCRSRIAVVLCFSPLVAQLGFLST
jgi:hypothetical protein